MSSESHADGIKANKSKWLKNSLKGVLGAAAVVGKQARDLGKDLGKQAVEAYEEWRSDDQDHPAEPAPLSQVIDENGRFARGQMNDCVSGLGAAGKYVVFGIMGPQNTGKSTLLNHLVSFMSVEARTQPEHGCKTFRKSATSDKQPEHHLASQFGTKFVMHQEDVLDQCTKGAWLSTSDLASNSDIHDATRNRFSAQAQALVVDLEGADGIERGTDKSLERRLTLFAMVVTDMLIVNTLASTVGLADGGCVPLLTMVFQVSIPHIVSQYKTGMFWK